MGVLREYWETGYDADRSIYGSSWAAQTFKAQSNYTITSVKLYGYRSGNCGTLTVSIRNSSAGVPTGSDLCSGTIAQASIPTNIDWIEIDLGDGTPLTSGTIYAIVVRATSGDSNNKFLWGRQTTGDFGVTGENGSWSNFSGDAGTWSSTTWDFYFRTFRDEITYSEGIKTVSINSSVSETDHLGAGYEEPTVFVLVEGGVVLSSQRVIRDNWDSGKPEDAESDKIYDEESKTWIDGDKKDGRLRNSLLVIAQNESGTANLFYCI